MATLSKYYVTSMDNDKKHLALIKQGKFAEVLKDDEISEKVQLAAVKKAMINLFLLLQSGKLKNSVLEHVINKDILMLPATMPNKNFNLSDEFLIKKLQAQLPKHRIILARKMIYASVKPLSEKVQLEMIINIHPDILLNLIEKRYKLSEAVQLAAVEQNPNLYFYLLSTRKKISDAVQTLAIKNKPSLYNVLVKQKIKIAQSTKDIIGV